MRKPIYLEHKALPGYISIAAASLEISTHMTCSRPRRYYTTTKIIFTIHGTQHRQLGTANRTKDLCTDRCNHVYRVCTHTIRSASNAEQCTTAHTKQIRHSGCIPLDPVGATPHRCTQQADHTQRTAPNKRTKIFRYTAGQVGTITSRHRCP